MPVQKNILLLCCTFLLSACFTFAQAQKWELKSDKDGVKTYYKKKQGIYEAKFVTSIETSLSGLTKLMGEVEQYPVWGYKVKEARLLKQVSDTEMYYYTRLDFPWPLDDRDVIMHSKMYQDPITRRLESVSVAVPDYIAPVPGVIRMQTVNSKWVMIPSPGGWVYTEYYIDSDPGGSLPDWVVNMGLDMGPRELFKSIRNLLKQPQYRDAKLAHIRN
jgi:hypothetical protein